MTVAELIAELQKLPPELKVIAKGSEWDCEVTSVGEARAKPLYTTEDLKPVVLLDCFGDESFRVVGA